MFPFLPLLFLFRFDRLESVFALAYAIDSFLTLLFYAADKRSAEQGGWRIPESCLHCWELFFGWPGALLGQRLFRHKNRKLSFQLVFWCCVVLNIAGTGFILFQKASIGWSGTFFRWS